MLLRLIARSEGRIDPSVAHRVTGSDQVVNQRLARGPPRRAPARHPCDRHRTRAIATELAAHSTHPDSEKTAEEATAEPGIPADDSADVIAFAISRPLRVTRMRSS